MDVVQHQDVGTTLEDLLADPSFAAAVSETMPCWHGSDMEEPGPEWSDEDMEQLVDILGQLVCGNC